MGGLEEDWGLAGLVRCGLLGSGLSEQQPGVAALAHEMRGSSVAF